MPTYIDTVLKESYEKLAKAVKKDMLAKGMAIITWGEETKDPRTELEAEVREILKSSLEHFAQMVEKEVEDMKIAETPQDIQKGKTAYDGSLLGESRSAAYNHALDNVKIRIKSY